MISDEPWDLVADLQRDPTAWSGAIQCAWKARVRAVRNTERGIEVLSVPQPEPSVDFLRVRVRSSGICGSDLHLIEWGPIPVTLGHEFAGVLDDGPKSQSSRRRRA